MSRSVPRPGASITVETPASSANLGPGFDSVGLALGVWDRCTVTVTDEPGVRVEVEGEGAQGVPRDGSHLVVRTMHRTWQALGVPAPAGLHLASVNTVPHGRGMGSSATAIVTGIVAAQAISGEGDSFGLFDPGFTNDLAARLEGHPDNASASIFGGATLSWSDDPEVGTTTVRLAIHEDVVAVVFAPEEQLSTAKARSVLPAHVRLADAAANSGRAALLAHALGHARSTWWRPRGTGCTRSRAGPRMPLRWPWSITCVGRVWPPPSLVPGRVSWPSSPPSESMRLGLTDPAGGGC